MNVLVYGTLIDEESRCKHYHSTLDIIAIKHKCCNKYYACIHCHNENESHEAIVWPKESFTENAVLCGSCKIEITIQDYFNCNNICPNCESFFNPKCSNHFHYYFEV